MNIYTVWVDNMGHCNGYTIAAPNPLVALRRVTARRNSDRDFAYARSVKTEHFSVSVDLKFKNMTWAEYKGKDGE